MVRIIVTYKVMLSVERTNLVIIQMELDMIQGPAYISINVEIRPCHEGYARFKTIAVKTRAIGRTMNNKSNTFI